MKRDSDAKPDAARRDEPLVCMKDTVAVARDRLRCLHPSSVCRFRDWCEIVAIVRAEKKTRQR